MPFSQVGLHARCVVVDRARAFVSSANFTQRGQERNIEVGWGCSSPTRASRATWLRNGWG